MTEMTVQLDHHIVHARDKRESAAFLTEILGLPAPVAFGPFMAVRLDNGVTLDFMDTEGPVRSLHYAFLITESKFDEVFGRIQERNLPYWADPHKNRAGEINTNDGGRGIYFEDPSGHFLEIITRPYDSGE